MRALLAASTSFLALGVGLAYAEEPRRLADDEIVVVGTPLDQRQADVLQGVVILDRGAVLDTLGQGLGDSLERQPGMASTAFAAGASRPIVRGLGEDRIRVLSNGLGQLDVSTISPDHAVTTEGLEAEKIEILRGPAAIAYGGNAVGGVVNVLDGRIAERLPESNFSGAVYGAVSDGLNSEELAGQATARLGALVVRAEGFTREAGDFAIDGFAFSEAARADAIAEGADPTTLARGRAPNSFADARSAALGVSLVNESGFAGFGVKRLDSQYGFPEDEVVALKQAGAPFIDMQSTRIDVRAGFSTPFWMVERGRIDLAKVDYEHSELEEGEVGTVFRSEGVEGRVELTMAAIGAWRGVAGLSGVSSKVSAVGDEAFLTPTEVEELGVFYTGHAQLDPVWSLEAGLRFDRRALDNSSAGERDFDTVSGSLGVGMRPTSEWFFAATVARTERAPTELELFANGPHKATQAFEVGDPDLGVETGLSVEGKARYDAGAWWAEASGFYIDFSDFITLQDTGLIDPVEGLSIFNFIQQDAVFKGGEITGGVTLVSDGDVRFGVDVGLDVVRAELDRDGSIARIPPMSATLGLDAAFGDLSGRLEVVSTADQNRVAAFESRTPGYDLINARLSWSPQRDERLVITLDGRNLTDELVREHTSFVKDLQPRPGRSFRLAIRSAF